MMSYRRSLTFLLVFFVLFEGAVVFFGDLTRPPWGDEYRLLETVRDFSDGPSIDRLKHYNQLSTPLPFVLYAAWGRVVGFELWQLRLLSLLIALLSYLLFHRILYLHLGSGPAALLAAVFLMINPYMVGFSIFVFTDGLTILFVILSLYAAVRSSPTLLFFGVAGSLLCRQYTIFLAAAAVIFYCVHLWRGKGERNGAMLGAAVAGLVPLLALFALWGGISPVNKWREFYDTSGLSFHPAYLVLYVSLLSIYLAPVLLFRLRTIYGNPRVLAGSLVVSMLYWIFPVEPSPYAVAIGVHTVGLFHKAFTWVAAATWFSHLLFYFGFLLGLPILWRIITSAWRNIRTARLTPALLYDLSIAIFLVVMPFSYLNWEKYFVPLLPLVIIRLLILDRREHAR